MNWGTVRLQQWHWALGYAVVIGRSVLQWALGYAVFIGHWVLQWALGFAVVIGQGEGRALSPLCLIIAALQ